MTDAGCDVDHTSDKAFLTHRAACRGHFLDQLHFYEADCQMIGMEGGPRPPPSSASIRASYPEGFVPLSALGMGIAGPWLRDGT